jgi:hypothetical protein
MIKIKLFDGRERDLVLYNGQAMLNFGIEFETGTCNDDLDPDNDTSAYDFASFVSGYFIIFNERSGRIIKTITGITVSGASLIINSNDLSFTDEGVYYYEIGYIQAGGYDITLMYGKLLVI